MTTGMRPDEAVSLDRLVGDWQIYQLRRGHRYNSDDILLAWTAQQACPDAARILDLGSGVGSVGLMVLSMLGPAAHLVGVELQSISVALARRTVAHNGLHERVEVRNGDLRDVDVLAGQAPFDLIMANPPYTPLTDGVASPHPQRRQARMEVNGDVFDVCKTAARHLASAGRFCLVHLASDPRPEDAICDAGLQIISRQDVVFRHNRPPMIAIWVCGLEGKRQDREPLTIRDAHNQWTAEYRAVRDGMKMVL